MSQWCDPEASDLTLPLPGVTKEVIGVYECVGEESSQTLQIKTCACKMLDMSKY